MSEGPPMPGFLRFVRVAGVPLGVLAVVSSLAFLGTASALPGPYSVNGEPASREEFLRFAAPLILSYCLVGVLAIAAAWGLRRARRWARPVLCALALWTGVFTVAAGALVGLSAARMVAATVGTLLLVGALGWYLYRREEVVAWFEHARTR